MARKEKAVDLGFVAPVVPATDAAPAEERDVFDQLLDDGQPVVDEAAEEERLGSLQEEWRILAALKAKHAALKEEASQAWEAYEAQRSRMQRTLGAQGTRQFRAGDGSGSCNLSHEYNVKVADREALMDWVREEAPELLTTNAQTLGSFIRKNYRDKGIPSDSDEFPPGLEITERETLRVSVRKEK